MLGTAKAATGSPIKVGLISDGKGASVDFGAEVPVVEATVKFVNAYLGGIGGHPVQLTACLDQQTPAGGTDCANKMIAANVSLVISGQSTITDPILAGLQPADIPYVTFSTASPKSLVSSESFIFANTITTVVGGALLAKETGATKSAMTYVDVPTNQGIPVLAKPVFEKAGSSLVAIPIPIGTADTAPILQAKLSGVKLIHINAAGGTCAAVMRGLRTLNYTGAVTGVSYCNTAAESELKGSSISKIETYGTTSADPNSDETKIFNAAMAKYNGPTTPFPVVSTGYGVLVGIARALENYTGATTPAAITAGLHAAPAVPLPLNKGATFKCDGKQVANLPAICSTTVTATDISPQAGKITAYKPADLSSLN